MKPSRKAVCWCLFSLAPSGSSCQQQDAAVFKPVGRAAGSAWQQGSKGDYKWEHPAFLLLSFRAMVAPTNFPCLSPCPSLPCLSLLNAAKSLQLLLVATKFLTHFELKVGESPDREKAEYRAVASQIPPHNLGCHEKRDRFVLLLGKSAFLPAWRGFSYLIFLGMPILEMEIRGSPWFPTLPLRTWLQLVLMALAAEMTWVSDVPNFTSVCW